MVADQGSDHGPVVRTRGEGAEEPPIPQHALDALSRYHDPCDLIVIDLSDELRIGKLDVLARLRGDRRRGGGEPSTEGIDEIR